MQPAPLRHAVAEMNILLILLSLRQAHRLDAMLKAGEPWAAAKNASFWGRSWPVSVSASSAPATRAAV